MGNDPVCISDTTEDETRYIAYIADDVPELAYALQQTAPYKHRVELHFSAESILPGQRPVHGHIAVLAPHTRSEVQIGNDFDRAVLILEEILATHALSRGTVILGAGLTTTLDDPFVSLYDHVQALESRYASVESATETYRVPAGL